MDIKLEVYKLARKGRLELKKLDVKAFVFFTVKVLYASILAGLTWQIIN